MSKFVIDVYNPFLRHNVPAPFKPASRKPVKGGRWKIRKTRNPKLPWKAWSEGATSGYRASFATHAEAMNIDENFYWHDGGRELNPYRKEDNHD